MVLTRQPDPVEAIRFRMEQQGLTPDGLQNTRPNTKYSERSGADGRLRFANSADRPRRPSFGDYTIQHATYREPVQGANPSASSRYTSDTYWVIMRGEGLRTPGSAGHAQYPANAELLCGRKEFRGPQSSTGDAYMWRIGSREDPRTGSPETWIRAGIQHPPHMTFAARQIRTIAEAGG